MRMSFVCISCQLFLAGCISHVYSPGPAECPLNQIRLGQNYGDMVSVLGEPDHSITEDLMGQELAILLLIPGWNLIEAFADFHPSALSVYTYYRWGTVTIDDRSRIIRVQSSQAISGRP